MNAFFSQSITKRVLSALLLAPLVLYLTYRGDYLFNAMLAVLAGISLYEWYGLAVKTGNRVLSCGIGVVYILAGFVAAYFFRMQAPQIAIVFLVALWGSDIGAYVAGKLIGGIKMAPLISPNKTWAGFGGALLFSMLIGLGTPFLLFTPSFEVWWWRLLLLGMVIAVSGQLGDLAVSLLKRQAHAKDSGDLIPGHGGLLDRIDSLLLAAPVTYVFILLFLSDVLPSR